MNSITIDKSGPLTTMQDLGRFGYQHLGLTQSGPADEHAFLWANKLLGNPSNTPCLEISLGPFKATFNEDTQAILAGAKAKCFRNDKPISQWQVLEFKKGDTLRIGQAEIGLHIYLAVHKGFVVDKHFGSSSTSTREGIGFNEGRRLVDGQKLTFHSEACDTRINKVRSIPARYIPNYASELTLNLIPSYQHAIFSDKSLETLTSGLYTISTQSNKMGYRLQGANIHYEKDRFVSEGIALGSVQVPLDGQPIILLKDRQTIGGYPKLGCIQQLDCFQLSQRRPGQKIRFHITTLEEAQKELQLFYDFFAY